MRALLLLLALLAPLPALAHAGDGGHLHGFADGLLHPIGGLDHLAAMLAVGAWGGLTGGRARWLLPLGFLAGMAAGGALGLAGVELPMVEAGILASVMVLGVLVGAAARLPVAAGMALLAAFGLLHGHAHGTELAEGAGAAAYAAGFLVATAGLHGAGLLLAARAGEASGRLALRAAGAAASVAALVALVA
jgi:urease accessory protein